MEKSPISGWEISQEDGMIAPCFEDKLPKGEAYSKDIDKLCEKSKSLLAYCKENKVSVRDAFQKFNEGKLFK